MISRFILYNFAFQYNYNNFISNNLCLLSVILNTVNDIAISNKIYHKFNDNFTIINKVGQSMYSASGITCVYFTIFF